MAIVGYRVVACEGGDQVGKADAILNFSQRILEMGLPVTYASFPIYATPIGTCIRQFLRNGTEEFGIEPIKDLKVKMSLYALNRLEFMNVLLSKREYKRTLILLDRSSFSAAVTIAYGIANNEELEDEEKVKELMEYGLDMEKLMIGKLRLSHCVVQMVAKDSPWENVRNEKKDINETDDVQGKVSYVYDLYSQKFGNGWRKIVTRTPEGWRDRGDISKDMYDFVSGRGVLEGLERKDGLVSVRYEIGIEEILKHIYHGEILREGLLLQYLNALRGNDKDTMHVLGCEIGESVGRTCKCILFSNREVRESARRICAELPEVYMIFQKYIGEEFVAKFKKAIDE